MTLRLEDVVSAPTTAPFLSPTAYALIVVGSTWVVVLGTRKMFPKAWVWLQNNLGEKSEALMALPALLTGSMLGAISNATDPLDAVKGAATGALLGLVAPLVHGTLRAAPGPYTGSLGK